MAIALFTLNFLNEDTQGRSAADRHADPDSSSKGTVMWKDILTGCWNGPDPVLVWARGSVCVFPQDQQQPIWVPEQLTRLVQSTTHEEESATTANDDLDEPAD